MSNAFSLSFLTNHTVQSLVDYWADKRADETFLIDPETGETVSFQQLQTYCRNLAAYLKHFGAVSGETIGYALTNSPNAAKCILGIMYGGFTATAINLVSGKQTIAHVLNHSHARVIICEGGTLPLLTDAAPDRQLDDFHLLENLDFAHLVPAENGPSTAPLEEALLMYTSGTTGVPKGVVHTHTSLLAGGGNTALSHQLSKADRGLCVLPLYHINGLCVTLIGALVSGSSLVMPKKFSVSSFWALLRENHCTWFSVVPTQISYLLHEAESNGHDTQGLENLRFGRSASAPLSPDVQQAFEARFQLPIIETMGLTETAAQILSNPLDKARKIGSPGIAFGNDIRIADDNQNEVARGMEGEVLVRGANVMKHYRNNEEATKASLTDTGWLRTGDLGRMDKDGYVFITGRLKELIIKGGENIAPREIDEALYSHPDVIEAAAFAKPCNQYGQRVEAGVKIREGSSLTSLELIAICKDKVGAFKAPDQIYIFDELPKGPSGKIQRIKLAEHAEALLEADLI